MPTVVWNADPVAWRFDGTSIRYYSLMMLASFVGGYLLMLWQMRRAGFEEEAGDFQSYAIPAGLIGARLGHCFFYDFDKAVSDPVWVLQIWTGGLASHGALVGIAFAMYLFTKRRGIAFLEGCDRFVFSCALTAALVRIGNLFNSEIVGKPTDGSWGLLFPRYDRFELVPRHPSQLYEALLGVVLLAALVIADRALGRERRPSGVLAGLCLVLYASGRIFVEFFKEPQLGELESVLNTGQLLSIPALVIGAFVLARSWATKRPAGWRVEAMRTAPEEAN
jgi:phosphatidylglycerol:prolipoprotein diacylglycerol transferase